MPDSFLCPGYNISDLGGIGWRYSRNRTHGRFSVSVSAGLVFRKLGVGHAGLDLLLASLITSDYKSRDIQCAIAQGHSRAHIMFAKIIVYIVAIWILSLEDILVYTVGGCICGGFGKEFTMDVAGYMLRSVACEGFVLTMLYMTCVFLAFALTSKAASVSVNLLLFFLVDLGVQICLCCSSRMFLEKILGYMPFSSVREMSQVDIDWSHAGISLAVAAAYGTVMIVATWLTFRKRDLR